MNGVVAAQCEYIGQFCRAKYDGLIYFHHLDLWPEPIQRAQAARIAGIVQT